MWVNCNLGDVMPTTPNKDIVAALNKQIAMEATASDEYLAMAAWCERARLTGCAKFFYAQSDEERGHMLKIFHYLTTAGAVAVVPARKVVPNTFRAITQVFALSYKQECTVTQSIYTLIDLCTKKKDYATLQLLQWFVTEQQEEERTFSAILDMIKLVGTEGHGLYLFDKEVGNRASSE